MEPALHSSSRQGIGNLLIDRIDMIELVLRNAVLSLEAEGLLI